MQVDDDDEPNYINDGGIAEIRSFNGVDYQKWIFTNAANEYYRTTSKISGYAHSYFLDPDCPVGSWPLRPCRDGGKKEKRAALTP